MPRKTQEPSIAFIQLGHGIICMAGVAYLVMLVLETYSVSVSVLMLLFLATFLLGFLGAGFVFLGISKLASFARRSDFRPYFLAFICLGVLAICIFVTTGLMGRLYTSEILFLYVWVTLESYVVYYAYLSSRLGPVGTWVSVGVLFASSMFGTALYALYFDQTGVTKFLFGTLPYVNVILAIVALSLLLAVGNRPGQHRQ